MQSCMQAGIRVIMITGDATQTAINIAQRCGMFDKEVCISHETHNKDHQLNNSNETNNYLKPQQG